jgi:N-acetylmuramoyl-L-alanine amidase
MEVKRIYLHWSATSYNWHESGHYHTVVQGNGNVVRLTPYDHFLRAHTWRRNEDAVAIAVACMGGTDYWRDYPPTEQQIDAMCKEAAQLAKSLGWTQEDITIQRVMTHAEAAANRDFPESLAHLGNGVSDTQAMQNGLPHANYGPVPWKGDGTRWDLMQLKKGGTDNGGEILRQKIKEYMTGIGSVPDPLRSISIDCNGTTSKGQRYQNMSTYAQIKEIASAYKFSVDWNAEKKKVYIYGENLPLPKYIHDDLGLNNVEKVDVCSTDGNIIMSGFLKDGHAYVRVVEFANEFNIPLETVDGGIRLGSLNNYGG